MTNNKSWEDKLLEITADYGIEDGKFDLIDGYIPLKQFISQTIKEEKENLIKEISDLDEEMIDYTDAEYRANYRSEATLRIRHLINPLKPKK